MEYMEPVWEILYEEVEYMEDFEEVEVIKEVEEVEKFPQ